MDLEELFQISNRQFPKKNMAIWQAVGEEKIF